jgi:putative pyruvate formate lyase activating enzyme
MKFEPIYIKTYKSKELENKIEYALKMLESCEVCPRKCKINRAKDEKGYCKTGRFAKVSSFFPHFGEETPIRGYFGSGTIFFSNCNLRCIFCQNYEISHLGEGEEISKEELAKIMIYLQNQGCHNINFVTPTHVVPQILESLPIAIENGLQIPIVYNTGGYDSLETIKLLSGIVDIYMPDIKFFDEEVSFKFCNAKDYPFVVKGVVKEMYKQVGDLKLDERGIAYKGLLIRHLVMPNNIANTKEVMEFISNEVSKNTYVNIMDQYRPCWKAKEYPIINRCITQDEYENAIKVAKEVGITRIDGYV